MIKFFRKIRQSLLSKGKTGAYFTYALGEILLVVIGILIALQVNNWNEERKLIAEEKRYVSELITDLSQDSLALVDLMNEAIIIGRSKTILVDFLDDPVQTTDSLAFHFRNQWISIQKFTPNTTTLDEMKSGIGLGVIRSDSLRRSLVSLYNDYDQWNVDDDVFQKSLDAFFKLSRVHLKNINAPTEAEIRELFKIREVANIVRTNYANSRKDAINMVLKHNEELLYALRNYQEEIE